MKIWFRKLKWMLIALIAPEIVLYTAWAQFYSARSLCKELNEHVSKHMCLALTYHLTIV